MSAEHDLILKGVMMKNKSLDAVIRGFEACHTLDCQICPYNKHDFPPEYVEGNCDRECRDIDALDYLQEYKERQNDLEKEIVYWRKQNEIVVNLVTILKAQKENILCKECEYYHEDHFQNNIIVAHHVCMKWGRGCITDPDGFCHYALKRGEYQDEHA